MASASPLIDEFPVRLRLERTRLGYSARELAELIGITRSTQQSYERGTTLPNAGYLIQGHAIGFNLHYLLGMGPDGVLLDRHLMAAIMDGLDQAAGQHELPNSRRAEILCSVYEQMWGAPYSKFRSMLRSLLHKLGYNVNAFGLN